MEKVRRPWLRGVATLALVGILAAGWMIAPATAGKFATKAKLKGVSARVTALEAGTGIYSSFKDGPVLVPNALSPVASLGVPAGKYAINAKLYVTDPSDAPTIQCDLAAGGDFDRAISLDITSSINTMALQVVHNFTGAGTITLSCTDGGDLDANASFIKITAIRGPSLSNTPSV